MNRRLEAAASLLAVGLCLGFVAAIGIGALADRPNTVNPEPGPTSPSASDPVATSVSGQTAPMTIEAVRQTAVTKAVSATSAAVVSITTEQPSHDLFSRFHGNSTQSSAGSGVVIDARGIILTNAHVVASASQITVTFSDNHQIDADVIGLADDLDLAVLRVPVRPGLQVATVGTSSDLLLGEPVIAIGNPFGLGHTVTTGVVSAVSRPLETDERVFQDFIQTDASINPGNSGGPLLNAAGALIGINTAIRADAEGIGFAIPIDRAIKVATDLIESGTVRIPWLGVLVDDVAFRNGRSRTTAPEVTAVLNGGGLQQGDVIVGVQDRLVQGRSDLNAFLASYSPGDKLDLSIIRNRKTVGVSVNTSRIGQATASKRIRSALGLVLTDAPQHRTVGVQVSQLLRGSTAARIGLRPGDLIYRVDGTRITSEADFTLMVQRAIERHRSSVLITVRRGNVQGRVPLPL